MLNLRFLLSCLILWASLGCNLATAQDYPTRPVKIVLSNSAGGSPDIVMRIVADRLSRLLGQQFFVENRPGGESVIGAELASQAPPDGYTLYLGTNDALVANRFRLKSLPYDPDKAFTPIANIVDSAPFVVVVHPDLPVKTFDELVSVAKARPDALSYGTTIGISDVLAQWINKTAGIDIHRIPYRQNPEAVRDFLSGRVQILLISLPSVEPFVQAGKAQNRSGQFKQAVCWPTGHADDRGDLSRSYRRRLVCARRAGRHPHGGGPPTKPGGRQGAQGSRIPPARARLRFQHQRRYDSAGAFRAHARRCCALAADRTGNRDATAMSELIRRDRRVSRRQPSELARHPGKRWRSL